MRRGAKLVLLAGSLPLVTLLGAQQAKEPVYVGARVCGSCHLNEGMGNQFSRWLLSKHARAYAVLAKPEARTIAELSGIPEEPQRSTMCLGCHATAVEAEEWRNEDPDDSNTPSLHSPTSTLTVHITIYEIDLPCDSCAPAPGAGRLRPSTGIVR